MRSWGNAAEVVEGGGEVVDDFGGDEVRAREVLEAVVFEPEDLSDRGVQYASGEYRQLLKGHGIVGSMSRRGNCWDNAVAERFFSRLKTEHLMWHRYQTRSSASASILNYIVMLYNSKRLHNHNGYATLAAVEREYAKAHDAA